MTSPSNNRPLVSIITPSLNQGRYIEETIQQVLNQTYAPIEYLVMDGGSTDETISILRRYDERIQWRSEPDRGQADALNKGFRLAAGEIIGWINTDDVYYPHAVQVAVEAFQADPDLDLVYGDGLYTDENGTIAWWFPTLEFSIEGFLDRCILLQPTAFFRKRVLDRVGRLREDLHHCMDYELWIRAAKAGCRARYIPIPVAYSKLQPECKAVTRAAEGHYEAIGMLLEHFGRISMIQLYSYAGVVMERVLFNARNPAQRLLWGMGAWAIGVLAALRHGVWLNRRERRTLSSLCLRPVYQDLRHIVKQYLEKHR